MRHILFLLAATACWPLTAQEAKEEIYIPSNPRAAAYVLARLSNEELLKAPRIEPVFIAIIERKGTDVKHREDALRELAQLRKTDRLTELLAAFNRIDAKGEEEIIVLKELAPLLLRTPVAELTAQKAVLEKLSAAQLSMMRQIAFAAWVTVEEKLDGVWRAAESDVSKIADLVGAVGWINDPKLRAEFFPKVQPLLERADAPNLRRAAILALPQIKGREAESFKLLAALIAKDPEPVAAQAMLQLPRSAWQKEQAAAVAKALTSAFTRLPVAQRSNPEALDVMQLAHDLSLLLPAEEGQPIRKALRAAGVQVIVLKTLVEQMLFDKTRLVVEAGKAVEIILENNDVMPHNLVITAPGAREEIGRAAEQMSLQADAQGRQYVPDSSKIIAATKLLQPTEREKLTFTAPTQTGDYDYVCTFPGHWMRMFGTLVVVKDIEEYLRTAPPEVAPKITEWKLADLTDDLARVGAHRSFARGKELFTKNCASCHQLGKEGMAFGPSLNGVLARFKGDRAAVLEQILDASSKIEDRYKNVMFTLKNDETVTGLVLSEDAESVTVQAGPSAAQTQKLPKAQIQARQTMALSLMPAGLLSMLDEEQILDLLAYVLAEGDEKNAAFHHAQ